MGFSSDWAREDETRWLSQKLKALIEKHKDAPEVVEDLKALGREALGSLPTVPEWAREYHELFQGDPIKKGGK